METITRRDIIEWDQVDGATGYAIVVDDDRVTRIAVPFCSAYTVFSGLPEGLHTVRVRAVYGASIGPLSDPEEFDLVGPERPINIRKRT